MTPQHRTAAAVTSAVRERREPGELFGARFVLFADMLAVGVFTALACLPLVTAPAAFAAACAVLRGAVREQRPATVGRYAAALRAHRPLRTLAAGAVALSGAALLLVDLLLARAGLPGARAVSLVVAAVGVAALVVGVRGASDASAARSWRVAVRQAAARSACDLPGSALVVVAVLLCAVLAWMLPLLVPLTPGALAFAVVAVELRGAEAVPGPAGSATAPAAAAPQRRSDG